MSLTAGELVERGIASGESDADPNRSNMCLAVVTLRYMAQVHPLVAAYLVKAGLQKKTREWLAQCKPRLVASTHSKHLAMYTGDYTGFSTLTPAWPHRHRRDSMACLTLLCRVLAWLVHIVEGGVADHMQAAKAEMGAAIFDVPFAIS